jgi:hypothetical protein
VERPVKKEGKERKQAAESLALETTATAVKKEKKGGELWSPSK